MNVNDQRHRAAKKASRRVLLSGTGSLSQVRVLDSATGTRITVAAPTQEALESASSMIDEITDRQRSIAALGPAIAANPSPTSPQLARSLQAQENWWRKIEAEHPWFTSTQVAQQLGRSANRNYASQLRKDGKLLGYRRANSYRYPAFQFDLRTGDVRPVIGDLLSISRRYDVPDEDVMLWLCSRSSLFAEQDRPVDHLDDPQLLLAAARDEFGAVW